jgi:hypothetical protein
MTFASLLSDTLAKPARSYELMQVLEQSGKVTEVLLTFLEEDIAAQGMHARATHVRASDICAAFCCRREA